MAFWHQLTWVWGGEGQGGANGTGYLVASGPIGDVFILGAAWALVRKLNCHAKGCWRLGLHRVGGTPYITCRKHHPHVPDGGATAEHIAAAHRAALERPQQS